MRFTVRLVRVLPKCYLTLSEKYTYGINHNWVLSWWGIELVSPNKNHNICENALYFKPRITVGTYLELTANFTSKISLHKV